MEWVLLLPALIVCGNVGTALFGRENASFVPLAAEFITLWLWVASRQAETWLPYVLVFVAALLSWTLLPRTIGRWRERKKTPNHFFRLPETAKTRKACRRPARNPRA